MSFLRASLAARSTLRASVASPSLAGVRTYAVAAGVKHTTNAAPSILRNVEDNWEAVRASPCSVCAFEGAKSVRRRSNEEG